jgi:ubiquinone/menaquinone biosynthesis C-methylase UbiE
MPEMSTTEKFFVNRHGTRSVSRVLDKLDRAHQLPLNATSEVLELGAGNGRLSILVNERYHPARIRLTDYDPDQLGVAKKSVEQQYGSTPPTLLLERADATRLQYANETFDLVVAHHILHHLGKVPDILRGLDEIHRVLRPGGRFFYAEMFHKREIRDHLAQLGFSLTFRERALRLFATADVVLQVLCHGANDRTGRADLALMRPGQVLIGILRPLGSPETVQEIVVAVKPLPPGSA